MVFDPDKVLAADIRIIENALVLPEGNGRQTGIARPAGVFDHEGRYLPLSQSWRGDGLPVTLEPEPPIALPEGRPLSGTWLFGGLLYQHFGHFLAESTSRFWALDHVAGQVDGVVFLPKKLLNRPKRFVAPLVPLLQMFSPVLAQAHAPVAALRVERLVLAPQGFGTGAMMAGSPEYRAFIRQNFGRDIPPDGAEKIYISRSRLFSKRGRYFGEAKIDALMEAEGYRIFHPQDHPVEEQIAQYKAAKRIVSSDSSALHLAAFFTGPQDRIAIILRRPGDIVNDFLRQFESFAGHRPDVIDALSGRIYRLEGAKPRQMSEVYTDLDFPALQKALAAGGYINGQDSWTNPSEAEAEAERADLAERLGRGFLPGTVG